MANKLEVSVGINNAAFKAGLDQMRQGVTKFKGDLSGMFTGAIGFAGISTAITNTVQYADTIADLSERFKVSSTALQQFGQAAQTNGSSLESLAGSMSKLEVARSKALQGDDKLIDSFKALNVSIEELQTLTIQDILLKIGSSSMDAAQMVQVLGKASLELRPMLEGLADGSIEMADAMGVKAVAALGNLADRMTELKNTITVGLGESVAWIVSEFETMSAAFTAVGGMLVANAAATGGVLKKIFTGDFGGIDAVIKQWKAEIKSLDQAFREFKNRSDGDPEEVGGKVKKRTFTDEDGEKEAEKSAQKREERLKKIKDLESAMARDSLEGQEKVNALTRERERLQGIALEQGHSDEGLDAIEKALQVEQEIERERQRMADAQKRRDKEVADEKEKLAKEDMDRQQRIMEAREAERQARDDDSISTLKGDDKIRALQSKVRLMQQDADELEKFDPEAAARKRTEIISVNAEIRGERKSMEDEQKTALDDRKKSAEDALGKARDAKSSAATVPVDSLGAVGGGRGNFGGGDATLRAAEKQVSIQERILAQLQQMTGSAEKKEANPWR